MKLKTAALCRRTRHLVWLFGTVVALPCAADPPSYPERPVRMIVPFGPGGMPDLVARVVGERLAATLKQPFIVDNRPGAGGNSGAAIAARAAADGYHLLMTPGSVVTINPGLYKTMPFDPDLAFAPVSLVAEMPILLVTSTRHPAKDVGQLVQAMKRDAGKAAFSSPGVGSALHLAGELFQRSTGASWRHVPYKSGGESVTAVLSGEVVATFTNLPVVHSHLKAGTLRALGVCSTTRMPQLPEVPTLGESGLPDFEATSWVGAMLPSATPNPLVHALSNHIARILREPDVQSRFTELGARLVGNSPADFSDYVRKERKRWESVIRAANIRLD